MSRMERYHFGSCQYVGEYGSRESGRDGLGSELDSDELGGTVPSYGVYGKLGVMISTPKECGDD